MEPADRDRIPLASSPPPAHPRSPTPLPEEPKPAGISNLTLRWITAALLVPPVIWVCWAGGWMYVAVVTTFILLALNEFYGLIIAKGATPHRLLGNIAAASLPVIAYVGDASLATTALTATLLTLMILQTTKQEIREAIASVSETFFGVIYVGWLLSYAVSVRFIASELERRFGAPVNPEVGFFYMIFCLAAVVCSDAGAYFVGRAYGKRKLAPAVSPNKTVEGAFGGVLTGGVLAVLVKLVFTWFVPGDLTKDLPWLASFCFGMTLAAFAVLGDLIESLLKRDAAIKDAGDLLPGVGGVLDRIDSALIGIPVMYYLLLAYYWMHYSS
ncbi:MAG TPA: phosphatidate cytidylyltransferase [Burkholderiales bacterium]|nr:phosphatidate cytidylyltransferase [Burkholderiales bacterium]